VHLWPVLIAKNRRFAGLSVPEGDPSRDFFLQPGLCAGVAGVSGVLAGNHPATISPKNGHNVHVVFLLRGSSIVSAYCNDRGCAGVGRCAAVWARLRRPWARTAGAFNRAFNIYISSVIELDQGESPARGLAPGKRFHPTSATPNPNAANAVLLPSDLFAMVSL
jgi:hypothetical protein